MVSQQEASRRRRLISASCEGVLSQEQTLSIIHLCDQQFANSEQMLPFRLFRSAQIILNYPAELSRTLVKRFTEKQSLPDEALGPDPLGDYYALNETLVVDDRTPLFKRRKPTPGTLNTVEKTARDVVFEFVIAKLLSRLDASDRPEVQSYLLKSISKAAIASETRVMLSGWIKGDAHQTADMTPVKADDMSLVFELVYGWYCEIFGPIRADQAITETINQAETLLPEANEFSPRRLL